MVSDDLRFDLAARFWSADHSSLCFDGSIGKRLIRFYLPRSCYPALCNHSSPGIADCLRIFDENSLLLIDAAQQVFERNNGYSNAYVITTEAIETAGSILRPVFDRAA